MEKKGNSPTLYCSGVVTLIPNALRGMEVPLFAHHGIASLFVDLKKVEEQQSFGLFAHG